MGQKSSGGPSATATPMPPLMGSSGPGASVASSIMPTTPGAPDPHAAGAPLGAPPIIPPMSGLGVTPAPNALSGMGAPSTALPGMLASLSTPQQGAPGNTARPATPPIVMTGNTAADQAMAANQKAAQDAVNQRLSQGGGGGAGGGSDLSSALASFNPEQLLALFA